MKWEYRVEFIDWFRKKNDVDIDSDYNIKEELNSIGAEGWELVNAIDDGEDAVCFTAFFKRPKEKAVNGG